MELNERIVLWQEWSNFGDGCLVARSVMPYFYRDGLGVQKWRRKVML